MDKTPEPHRTEEPEATRGERVASALIWGLAIAAVAGLGPIFGFLRTIVALGMFAALAYFGTRQVRSMMTDLPDPEPTDVSGYGLKYVCGMCGLELRVEIAARDKPPTHCMEPMELVRTD